MTEPIVDHQAARQPLCCKSLRLILNGRCLFLPMPEPENTGSDNARAAAAAERCSP